MFPGVGAPLFYPRGPFPRRWTLINSVEGVTVTGDLICIIVGSQDLDKQATDLLNYYAQLIDLLNQEQFENYLPKNVTMFDTSFAFARRIKDETYDSKGHPRRRSISVPDFNRPVFSLSCHQQKHKYSKNLDLHYFNSVPSVANNFLEIQSISALECLLNRSSKWDFDTFALNRLSGGSPVVALGCKLFQLYDFVNVFQLSWTRLRHCLSLIENGYHSNPYHNSIHAADVAQAVNCFLHESYVSSMLSPLEKMSCILAAFGHDLYHPGVNQKFLENSQHFLCKLYKVSVLENFHWRCLVSILLETSLLSHTSKEEWRRILHILEILILATDMQRQQEYLDQFRIFLSNHSKYEIISDEQQKLTFMQILIKCADIANPCRPWELSKKWSLRASKEFFNQGDLERQQGYAITEVYNRYLTTVPKVQSGFMEYIAQPLFIYWDQFISTPLSNEMIRNLQANCSNWLKLQREELMEEEVGGAKKAIASVTMETEPKEAEPLDTSGVSDSSAMTSSGGQEPMEKEGQEESEIISNLLKRRSRRFSDVVTKRRASASAATPPLRYRQPSLYDEETRRVSLPVAAYSSSTLWTATSKNNRRLYQALSVGQLTPSQQQQIYGHPPSSSSFQQPITSTHSLPNHIEEPTTVSLRLRETSFEEEESDSPPSNENGGGGGVTAEEGAGLDEDPPLPAHHFCSASAYFLPTAAGFHSFREDEEEGVGGATGSSAHQDMFRIGTGQSQDDVSQDPPLSLPRTNRRYSEPAALVRPLFTSLFSTASFFYPSSSSSPNQQQKNQGAHHVTDVGSAYQQTSLVGSAPGGPPRRGSLPMTQKELQVFRMVSSSHELRSNGRARKPPSAAPLFCPPIGAW